MNLYFEIVDWNPLFMIFMACFVMFVIYILYRMGNSTYRKTKYKGEPFLSGNPPVGEWKDDLEPINIRGDSFYWGFIQALKFYFKPLIAGHTGRLNDYIFWFIITLVVVMVVLSFA